MEKDPERGPGEVWADLNFLLNPSSCSCGQTSFLTLRLKVSRGCARVTHRDLEIGCIVCSGSRKETRPAANQHMELEQCMLGCC